MADIEKLKFRVETMPTNEALLNKMNEVIDKVNDLSDDLATLNTAVTAVKGKTVDSEPTEDSTNLVTSGGVYAAIHA